MLLGYLKESREKEIVVHSQLNAGTVIRYPIFAALVKYLYIDEIEVDFDEDRLELLILANHYSIDRLKNLCENDLIQSIDPENAACLFSLADEQNALNLRAKCLAFMSDAKNRAEVLSSWSFEELGPDLKEEVLENCRRTEIADKMQDAEGGTGKQKGSQGTREEREENATTTTTTTEEEEEEDEAAMDLGK